VLFVDNTNYEYLVVGRVDYPWGMRLYYLVSRYKWLHIIWYLYNDFLYPCDFSRSNINYLVYFFLGIFFHEC
jgi:hypothetical protein